MSGDGNQQNENSTNKRALPVPDTAHPFFQPISVKRANTAAASCNDTSDGTASGTDSKRSKPKPNPRSFEKRGRRPKNSLAKTGGNKTTTLQTFFNVKPNRSDAQPSIQSDSPVVDLSIDTDATDYSSNAPTNTESAATLHPRLKIRPIGIPTPYPQEHSHVPVPVNTAFVPSKDPECTTLSNSLMHKLVLTNVPSALELYAQGHDGLANNEEAKWRDLMPKLQPEQQLHSLSLDNADNVVNTPIRACIGASLSPTPQHLQFAEPLLDILYGKKSHDQQRNTQLLVSRYRPRRAREVLDNCRAVADLQSWIESMRLKRTSASGKFSNHIAATADALPHNRQLSKLRNDQQLTSAKRQNRKNRRIVAAAVDIDSEFSDNDFIPARSSRRQRNNDELGDVLAWAHSDGTLNSICKHSRRPRRHKRRDSDSGSNSEAESFSNIILLEGPSGSCKTAAIYACANECGFEVYELHPGQRRSGKDVLEVLEDAILSHTINMPTSNAIVDKAAVSQMLILIEHIDVLFEQDQRLWPALKQLALKSRRPIVLTCNDITCIRWDLASFHSVLRFQRPAPHILVPYCFLMCLAEKLLVPPADLAYICSKYKCDINSILNHLEFSIRPCNSIDGCTMAIATTATVDLSGTLAWLSKPLEHGDTMQTRYDLWIDMVASAQTHSAEWFRTWLEAPEPVEPPPRLASIIHAESVYDPKIRSRRFFGRNVGTAELAEPKQPTMNLSRSTQESVYLQLTPLKLACGLHSSPEPCTSDNDQLNAAVEALELMSLACTFRDHPNISNECLQEPLYSSLAPMSDGCMNIDYIVLDPDVISRRNPSLLPDNAGAELNLSKDIENFIVAAGEQALVTSLSLDGGDFRHSPCLESQKGGRLLGPSELVSDCKQTGIRDAIEYTGIAHQQVVSLDTADTVAYLASMVRWDWIHQGKLESPANAPESSENEHIYRIGARRTRQRTYRAHINF
ncbi:hypothetical protein LPJ79_001818 [Coemansia sp. RSA 1821]|nr:hypothetical protein LPJ79_001818 [Coemansia sp. RSA 1821]